MADRPFKNHEIVNFWMYHHLSGESNMHPESVDDIKYFASEYLDLDLTLKRAEMIYLQVRGVIQGMVEEYERKCEESGIL